MDGNALCQLAGRFVRGELPESELGVVIASAASHVVLAPSIPGLAGIELERAQGVVFGVHAWCTHPPAFDLAAWTQELGAPWQLPRFLPDDAVPMRFTPRHGLVVVDVDRWARVVAFHAYRFAADSLAGPFTSVENVF